MASGVRVDDGHIEGAKHAFMGHRVAGGQRARGPIWASTTARDMGKYDGTEIAGRYT